MFSVATFRDDYPEFDDGERYPDRLINRWLSVGQRLLSASAWGDLLDHGLGLYIAHHISIQGQNILDAAFGGQPGQNKGPVASKTVDKDSVTFDTSAASIDGAGNWNATTYGVQFYQLVQLVGAGGAQVGTGGGVVIPSMGFWSNE